MIYEQVKEAPTNGTPSEFMAFISLTFFSFYFFFLVLFIYFSFLSLSCSILHPFHLDGLDSAARISTARLYGGAIGGWTGSKETWSSGS